MAPFGYSDEKWKAAISEAREMLIVRAKQADLITYLEFAANLRSIEVEPHDPRLFHLLGDLSREELAEPRGMLSALVVHKSGTKPGEGFFELARELGRDTSDYDRLWIEEVTGVQSFWSTSA